MLDIFAAIRSLVQASKEFEAADSDMVSRWKPEELPPTIRMAGFAQRFAASLDVIPENDRLRILELIERFLEEGDDAVKNAVATGFLEALLAESSAGRFNFSQIEAVLGKKSRDYCRAWNRFTSIGNEPGINGIEEI